MQVLISQGQHPRNIGDTFLLLEALGHYLDREVQYQYDRIENKEKLTGIQINDIVEQELEVPYMMKNLTKIIEGGYVLCGILGSGDCFAVRDPWGIRPAFYYYNDEFLVLTSERPVIQTAFDLHTEDIKELNPGELIVVKKNGEVKLEQVVKADKVTPCSFERIYFSRGSDADIYKERKELGRLLVPIISS